MRAIILFILIMAVGGCNYGPHNVISYEPYSAYAARPIPLIRHAFLFKENGHIKMGYDWLEHLMVNAPAKERPKHFIELAPGTVVWIREVRRDRDFEGGGYVVEAIGDVSIPGAVKPISFRYFWGYDRIHRAPWEDCSVPAERPAGYIGQRHEQIK